MLAEITLIIRIYTLLGWLMQIQSLCAAPAHQKCMHSPTSNLFILHLIVKPLTPLANFLILVVSFNKPETLSSKVSCKYAYDVLV